MYLDFFGFDRKPFHDAPNPELFFPCTGHKEVLAVITHGIQSRQGVIELVGDAGLGKTLILRTYLQEVEEDNLERIVLFNPKITFRELLEYICHQLGREFPAAAEPGELVDHIHSALIEEYRRNRNVAIIVDEAQSMPIETLEQLGLLSNLKSSGGKLLQILLVGQPELDEKLNSDNLRALKQSIQLRTELLPLSASDSAQYMEYLLSKVAGDGPPLFTKAAMKRIVKYCQGIPRKINIVCDNAFTAAYGYQKRPVSRKIVDEVIANLDGAAKSTRRSWILVWTAACLILVAAVVLHFGKTRLHKSLQLPSGSVISKSHPPNGLDGNEKVTVQSDSDDVRKPVRSSLGPAKPGNFPSADVQVREKPENAPVNPGKKDTLDEAAGGNEQINSESKKPVDQESKEPIGLPGVVTSEQPEATRAIESKPETDEQPSRTEQPPGFVSTKEVQPAPEPQTPAKSETVSSKDMTGPHQPELEDLSDYIDTIIKKHQGR